MNFKDLIRKYEKMRKKYETMHNDTQEDPMSYGGREHAGYWEMMHHSELILIDGFLNDLRDFENDGRGMVLQLDFVSTVQNFLRVMYGRKGCPGEWQMADGSSIGNFWAFVHRIDGQFTMMTGFPYDKWEAEQERLKKLDEEKKLEEKRKLEAMRREEQRKFIRKSELKDEATHTDTFGSPKKYGWKRKYEKDAFVLIKRACLDCVFNEGAIHNDKQAICTDNRNKNYKRPVNDIGGHCFTGKVRCVTCDNIFEIQPQVEVHFCPECKTKGFISEVSKSELEKNQGDSRETP